MLTKKIHYCYNHEIFLCKFTYLNIELSLHIGTITLQLFYPFQLGRLCYSIIFPFVSYSHVPFQVKFSIFQIPVWHSYKFHPYIILRMNRLDQKPENQTLNHLYYLFFFECLYMYWIFLKPCNILFAVDEFYQYGV